MKTSTYGQPIVKRRIRGTDFAQVAAIAQTLYPKAPSGHVAMGMDIRIVTDETGLPKWYVGKKPDGTPTMRADFIVTYVIERRKETK